MSSIPSTIVFGSGLIGKRLHSEYQSQEIDTILVGRSDGEVRIDLCNYDRRSLKIEAAAYNQVVFAAGIGDLQRCEREKTLTSRVNVENTIHLMEDLSDLGLQIIFLSSDRVFDGETGGYSVEDRPRPSTEYGRQKRAVEEYLESRCDNSIIIRLSKVYSNTPGDGSLLDQCVSRLFEERPIPVAVDHVFNPTLLDDVISAIVKIQASGRAGLFHVCPHRHLSRFQLVSAIASMVHVGGNLVQASTMADLVPAVRLPSKTWMIPYDAGLGLGFRDILEVAQEFVKARMENAN